MNTKASDIYIKPSQDTSIRVVVYSKEDNVTINQADNILNITAKEETCHFLCFNLKISRIEVYLPKNYENQITINNEYGDINFANFEYADIKITMDYGDLTIDKVKNATIKNAYGDITINEISNYIALNSEYGDITIEKLSINENSSIYEALGDININYTNDIYIEANTSLGDIKINKNNHLSNITLKLNNDCGDISVNN